MASSSLLISGVFTILTGIIIGENKKVTGELYSNYL